MTRNKDEAGWRFSLRRGDQEWEPKELAAKLEETIDEGTWLLCHWPDSAASSPRLRVSVDAPPTQLGRAASMELLLSIRGHLKLALTAYAKERNWPLPAVEVDFKASEDSDWSYRGLLDRTLIFNGEIQRGKLLAIGEPEQLSGLLGLETLDPFMALPAKWIAPAQREQAMRLGMGAIFDESSLIAAHTLHGTSPSWAQTFGLSEALQWLSSAPLRPELLESVVLKSQGLFLETLKELIESDLWLPPADQFVELMARKLPMADLDPWMLIELLRTEVVPENLSRWQDEHQTLWAVEWRSDSQMELSNRHLRRLEHAFGKIATVGTPVVLTDLENRRGLAQALRHAFPGTPVLSWQELETAPQLNVVAVVDARMEFDPSPWPGRVYEFGNFDVQRNPKDN